MEQAIEGIPGREDEATSSVFGAHRDVPAPEFDLPEPLRANERLCMDGAELLKTLPSAAIPVAFFDPQYRGILDKMAYGNEGKNRGKRRVRLAQMDEAVITAFIREIGRVLVPTGHLFLWMDKFHLCTGFRDWLDGTELDVVDLIGWDKARMGMGYRTRRVTEYCLVLQKHPRKAKGVWKVHNIPDTWQERLADKQHVHQKPINLQAELISAVTNEGDFVLDPAAGSFSVMEAAQLRRRNFIGCDLNG